MEKRLIIPVCVSFFYFGIPTNGKTFLVIPVCIYNWHPGNAITTTGSYDFIDGQCSYIYFLFDNNYVYFQSVVNKVQRLALMAVLLYLLAL
jgi:hypothetical protein